MSGVLHGVSGGACSTHLILNALTPSRDNPPRYSPHAVYSATGQRQACSTITVVAGFPTLTLPKDLPVACRIYKFSFKPVKSQNYLKPWIGVDPDELIAKTVPPQISSARLKHSSDVRDHYLMLFRVGISEPKSYDAASKISTTTP